MASRGLLLPPALPRPAEPYCRQRAKRDPPQGYGSCPNGRSAHTKNARAPHAKEDGAIRPTKEKETTGAIHIIAGDRGHHSPNRFLRMMFRSKLLVLPFASILAPNLLTLGRGGIWNRSRPFRSGRVTRKIAQCPLRFPPPARFQKGGTRMGGAILLRETRKQGRVHRREAYP